MNSRSNLEPLRHAKINRLPISKVDDPRLDWLTSYVDYLNDWEASTHSAPTPQEAKKRFLSDQTALGLKMTTFSMQEIVVYLLSNGAPRVYTANFNQDPLESSFSVQRAAGVRFTNPSVHQFGLNNNIVRNLKVYTPGTGNCKPAYLC